MVAMPFNKSFRVDRVLFAAPVTAMLALGGCVVSGPSLDSVVDRETVTGSIAPPPPVDPALAAVPPTMTAPDQISDQRMVRNAVSAADLSRAGETVAWANSETGASGTITAINETREGSRTCRAFTTTRQRFDGIALYSGEACTRGAGEWVLVSFAENG